MLLHRKKRHEKSYFGGDEIVKFHDVCKSYDGKLCLNNVNFSIKKGAIATIIGPSGTGKTTTARILNGLENYDSGEVYINGVLLTAKNVKKTRKHTAFVFQNFNLFPHMSVLNNITYAPIKVYHKDKEKVIKTAMDLLRDFGLEEHAAKLPHQLSGGQKQRVAIIRALILHPDILIMDEPTASLDPDLTTEVANIIKKINQQGLTVIVITHDMPFAESISTQTIRFENRTK